LNFTVQVSNCKTGWWNRHRRTYLPTSIGSEKVRLYRWERLSIKASGGIVDTTRMGILRVKASMKVSFLSNTRHGEKMLQGAISLPCLEPLRGDINSHVDFKHYLLFALSRITNSFTFNLKAVCLGRYGALRLIFGSEW